ncbi:tetratricopeptide repeat protein [Acidithiobacillus sp.]|uniref:tetratricopeptide repeat protein n=1 Tax=Acidithiobacillus sp. TaxID=1872118 RepID=UPI0025C3F1B9|nr:tetratricopeptide repeat protein [Acidithiobacillus sp.]
MTAQALVIDVREDNFAAAVLEESKRRPVVVDFWAPWCGPCRALGPVLEKLAEEMAGAFLLAKVNSDENPELSRSFQVRGIPAVKAFRDGKVVDEFTGALPESAVRKFLEGIVPPPGDDLRQAALAAMEAGREDEAEKLFREALTANPRNDAARLSLARLHSAQGRWEEVNADIAAMSPAFQLEDEVQALKALLEFSQAVQSAPPMAELERRLREAQGDERAQALYLHALRLLLQGQEEPAMEELLELVRDHRQYGDDLGRRTLLQIFTVLGARHPLVEKYRTRLARTLY